MQIVPFFLFQIDQAALGLSREYLSKGFDDKIVKAYYEYMIDIAVIYGAERSRAERELKESIEFEMKLANVSFFSLSLSISSPIALSTLLTLYKNDKAK